MLLLILLSSPQVQAQELQPILTLSGGSGLSLGQGEEGVLKRRSPIFLDIDVGLIFDGDESLEWTPSLIMELEQKVSVGVNPSLKRVYKFRKLGIYGGLGFPFYFAPFTLLGVEAALGATYPLRPRLGLAFEIHTDVFFAGSDLPDDSVLAKMDLSLGIRFDL